MRVALKEEKRFALIGNPLGHSVSPFIHRELMAVSKVTGTYTLQEVLPQELEQVYCTQLRELNGFNVTIPYKTAVLPLLDALSARAALFGAVNTVVVQNGKTKGYNTDGSGFLKALAAANISLQGRVLVLGCGGAARTFAFESALAGAAVTIAARHSEKATGLQQALREKLGCNATVCALADIRGEYDVLLNATPVGMTPHIDAAPVSEAVVKRAGAVFDAVYNPQETVLLRYARENGILHENGLSMLVWQAAAAEELWNNVSFKEAEIAAVIRKTKEELRR